MGKWDMSAEEYDELFAYLTNVIFLVCSDCGYDYHIAGTAAILFRRIYHKLSKSNHSNANNLNDDPRLVAVVCVFITAKSKDCNIKSIKTFLSKIRRHDANFQYGEEEIMLSELQCLHILSFDLNIFLPFEVCSDLLMECCLLDILGSVWQLLLKTFKSDIYLLYPPYLIAMASIFIVVCTQSEHLNVDFKIFMQKINIPFEDIEEVSARIIKKLFVKKKEMSNDDDKGNKKKKQHSVPMNV